MNGITLQLTTEIYFLARSWKIQNDTIPRDGWKWLPSQLVSEGDRGVMGSRRPALLLALGLSSFAGYRLYIKNNSEKNFKMLFLQMKKP